MPVLKPHGSAQRAHHASFPALLPVSVHQCIPLLASCHICLHLLRHTSHVFKWNAPRPVWGFARVGPRGEAAGRGGAGEELLVRPYISLGIHIGCWPDLGVTACKERVCSL